MTFPAIAETQIQAQARQPIIQGPSPAKELTAAEHLNHVVSPNHRAKEIGRFSYGTVKRALSTAGSFLKSLWKSSKAIYAGLKSVVGFGISKYDAVQAENAMERAREANRKENKQQIRTEFKLASDYYQAERDNLAQSTTDIHWARDEVYETGAALLETGKNGALTLGNGLATGYYVGTAFLSNIYNEGLRGTLNSIPRGIYDAGHAIYEEVVKDFTPAAPESKVVSKRGVELQSQAEQVAKLQVAFEDQAQAKARNVDSTPALALPLPAFELASADVLPFPALPELEMVDMSKIRKNISRGG